jgi:DNA-binding transcriptional LysR family regulator
VDRADRLRTFVEAARLGSFSSAARKLDLTRDQVSKHVAALESELGAPLFARTTRSLRLTGAGETLLARAENIIRLLDEALSAVSGLREAPRGTLRINAPLSFGLAFLSPLLPAFHDAFPEISLRLELDDRFVDPAKSGADVTLRIAHLAQDLALIARPIARAPRMLVAAPRYLESRGTPRHPVELSGHACLHYGDLALGAQWQFTRGAETTALSARGPLCSNNGDILHEAARAGMGLTVLPRFIVQGSIDRGELCELLADWEVSPSIRVYALYSVAGKSLPAVRAFVDFVQVRLAEHPALGVEPQED